VPRRITVACETVIPVMLQILGQKSSIVWKFVGPPRAHMWRSTEDHQNLKVPASFSEVPMFLRLLDQEIYNFVPGRISAGHTVFTAALRI
jgi:hypothetical protein